ncbi:MAG: hypothetical protein K9M99_05755 [Candidatus Cloacimonetes bacterium]|nr:hypothetical protein [Candidatus Cloacimonadota bacterium]
MRYFMIIMLLLAMFAQADDLTVYQTNGQAYALVHSSQSARLTKGENTIELLNLSNQIRVNSLLLTDDSYGIQIISQDFKPNFSRITNIFEYTINRQNIVKLADSEPIQGTLKFFNDGYLGINQSENNQFHLIKEQRIIDFQFPGIFNDQNDFTPSISWLLDSPKTQDIELNFSYLTGGIGWKAIYQTIWNDETNELVMNSQVELTNNCGKDFLDSQVKLIAGDVQELNQEISDRGYKSLAMDESMAPAGFGVSHSPISSFHLYTLGRKINLPDNSSRQFQLYPSATIDAEKYFFFNSNGYETKLQKTIAFQNSTKTGFGKPLPQGIVKMYTPDKNDGQLQFIGDSRLENSPVGKKVILVLGDAFDLSAETKTMNVQYSDNRRRVESSDYQITITNNSTEEADILVRHQLDRQLPQIYSADFEYEKLDVNSLEIHLKVAADSQRTLKWSQKR